MLDIRLCLPYYWVMATPDKIRSARQARGLTLQEAIRLMGGPGRRNRQQWHEWETGRRTPNLSNLRRIARVLRVDPADLL